MQRKENEKEEEKGIERLYRRDEARGRQINRVRVSNILCEHPKVAHFEFRVLDARQVDQNILLYFGDGALHHFSVRCLPALNSKDPILTS